MDSWKFDSNWTAQGCSRWIYQNGTGNFFETLCWAGRGFLKDENSKMTVAKKMKGSGNEINQIPAPAASSTWIVTQTLNIPQALITTQTLSTVPGPGSRCLTTNQFWCQTTAGGPVPPGITQLKSKLCALLASPWRSRRGWHAGRPRGLCSSRTAACSPARSPAGGCAGGPAGTGKGHIPGGLGHPGRGRCSGNAAWNQERNTESEAMHGSGFLWLKASIAWITKRKYGFIIFFQMKSWSKSTFFSPQH